MMASRYVSRWMDCQQPVVEVWLHSGPPARLPRWGPRSTGDASPPHPNAAAALGTPAGAALLLLQILPVLPPHRANHARRGPRFSVVAPCPRGASPVSVRRQTFTTGCLGPAGGSGHVAGMNDRLD